MQSVPSSVPAVPAPAADADAERVNAKVSKRLLWFIFLLFVFSFLDRINIGFAGLTMMKDLGLTSTQFGLATTLFYIAYIACGIPSNIVLARIGARRWIGAIMIAWGLASSATMFATDHNTLYLLRVLVGITEAGFLPGMLLYLTFLDSSVCHGSRAICISRRSLEIVERLGAVEGFLKIGLPWTGGRSFYRDTEVLHFTMPQDDNQKLPPMINLAQYHIEQILLDAAERHADLIDIRWQTRVTAMAQGGAGVTLQLDTADGNYALQADWMVAAGGGRSTIREAMDLQLTGASYEGRYVIVDIALESARPTERLAYFDPPSNPGSTVRVHKQPDNIWRIDYQVGDGENAEQAVLPENVLPRVQSLLDMMGERGPWSPIWITMYKANALTLEKYRHGRVLFAATPPTWCRSSACAALIPASTTPTTRRGSWPT
jgi:hypothetical protein